MTTDGMNSMYVGNDGTTIMTNNWGDGASYRSPNPNVNMNMNANARSRAMSNMNFNMNANANARARAQAMSNMNFNINNDHVNNETDNQWNKSDDDDDDDITGMNMPSASGFDWSGLHVRSNHHHDRGDRHHRRHRRGNIGGMGSSIVVQSTGGNHSVTSVNQSINITGNGSVVTFL